VSTQTSGSDTRLLHPLHRPRPVKIDAAETGQPLALDLSGRRIAVESVVESWRIDDEWWRAKAVSRQYWRVALDDGRVVDVYRDLASDKWFKQAYG